MFLAAALYRLINKCCLYGVRHLRCGIFFRMVVSTSLVACIAVTIKFAGAGSFWLWLSGGKGSWLALFSGWFVKEKLNTDNQYPCRSRGVHRYNLCRCYCCVRSILLFRG